ncbi:MAG: OB-fold nucleic acid binding domain-containing protein [Candidatus Nanoarchaeia archaeon]|nr:OB-fold nucleic acid binding domain-containing protein [Candidatus Nanoarchaeia archaeon]
MYERFVAKKLDIKRIINSKVEQDDKNRFIMLGDEKASRVRLMGTVVQKFVSQDNTYSFIVIDDGTETIRIRAFEEQTKDIAKIKEGDIIETIGRIRDYNDETYIIPDFVKKVENPNYLITRKLELLKINKNLPEIQKNPVFEAPKIEIALASEEKKDVKKEMPSLFLEKKEGIDEEKLSEEIVSESIETEPASEKTSIILRIKEAMKELDLGYGVNPHQVAEHIKESENQVYDVMTKLMKEGDIFEPKPGKFKILD